jgi:hypothetical protein
MHDIRPVIETLKSAMLHKPGKWVDFNFQYGNLRLIHLFGQITVEHGKQPAFGYIHELKDS